MALLKPIARYLEDARNKASQQSYQISLSLHVITVILFEKSVDVVRCWAHCFSCCCCRCRLRATLLGILF